MRSAERTAETDEKWSFFSIFNRLGPYSEVFGEMKELVILKLHEMIKVLYVAACQMNFNLLSGRRQQLGVLKMLLF